MGIGNYNEFSSAGGENPEDNKNGKEEGREKKKKESDEEEQDEKEGGEHDEKQERLSVGGCAVENEEIVFGEQLQDDLINSFCDKLQRVCPRRLEACMAIQFLMITDVADIRKHVTGKNQAIQVLYDRTRSHYVLVYYNSKYNKVELFDSLQQFDTDGSPMVLTELVTHISHLFGHLFTKYIPCIVDGEFEKQNDNFSCGYRVVGALVDLARQRNPASQSYSRTMILQFMRLILAHPNPTWQMFELAKFGKTKPSYSGSYRASIYLMNSTYSPSATTSSSSSMTSSSNASLKRTISNDSMASNKSGRSDDGSSGAKKKRASAGFYTTPIEEYDADVQMYHPIPIEHFSSPLGAPPPPRHHHLFPSRFPLRSIDNQPVDHLHEHSALLGGFIRNCQNMFPTLFRRKTDQIEDVEKGREQK